MLKSMFVIAGFEVQRVSIIIINFDYPTDDIISLDQLCPLS